MEEERVPAVENKLQNLFARLWRAETEAERTEIQNEIDQLRSSKAAKKA